MNNGFPDNAGPESKPDSQRCVKAMDLLLLLQKIGRRDKLLNYSVIAKTMPKVPSLTEWWHLNDHPAVAIVKLSA